ncbi:hypothetical protein M9434_002500 [Picochlorum sp. BPE23]|nr:hypothetical protein M9434_002500 [Picochlorum sp. BPE23]
MVIRVRRLANRKVSQTSTSFLLCLSGSLACITFLFVAKRDDSIQQETIISVISAGKAFVCLQNVLLIGDQIFLFANEGAWTQVGTGIGYGTPFTNIIPIDPLISNLIEFRRVTYLKQASIFSVMWPNAFRTLYGTIAAASAAENCDLSLKESVILLKESKIPLYKTIIEEIVTHPVNLLNKSSTNVAFIRSLVVGTDSNAKIAELEEEPFLDCNEPWSQSDALRKRLCHRNQLYQEWLAPLRPSRLDGREVLTVTVIERMGSTRILRNNRRFIYCLSRILKRVAVRKVSLEGLSLSHIVKIMGATDVLIAVHGAALANMFAMKPESFVIELFPYEFEKKIYRNFAMLSGLRYLSWKSPKRAASTFDIGAIESLRSDPSLPLDKVMSVPVNWSSLDSKNYWRNQNFSVDINQVVDLAHMAVASLEGEKERFLMFMPWEQLNNQLVGIRSACAMARMLNRTLVLPSIGYRTGNWSTFDPRSFVWKPYHEYFDIHALHSWPCRWVTLDNARFLVKNIIDVSIYNPVSPRDSNFSNQWYFRDVEGFSIQQSIEVHKMYQLSREEILRKLSPYYDKKVIAFGSLFWVYNFEKEWNYPLESFIDFMDNNEYRKISQGIVPKDFLVNVASDRAQMLGKFLAVHIRGGDYVAKCAQIKNVSLNRHCKPTETEIIRAIVDEGAERLIDQVYISTNDRSVSLKLQRSLASLGFTVFSTFDFNNAGFDDIQKSLVDIVVCSKAFQFIGNYFSSFTRSIVEIRTLSGQNSKFW